MRIDNLLKYGINCLNEFKIESSVLEVQLMLCHLLSCDKVFLYTHGEKELSEEIINEFNGFIEERQNGRPLQYILGTQEFFSLEFGVDSNVLIPRQDTEILVETVLDYVSKKEFSKTIEILDIGTGSGCIAIGIAKNVENSKVTAVDISKDALRVARNNAIKNNVENKIEFINSDLFESIQSQKFDIIVSNPPYIPTSHIEGLQKEVVDNEPSLALDGGVDGLDYYRLIVSGSKEYLKRFGGMFFEVGIDQANDVKNLMNKSYTDIKFVKDYGDIDRVVFGIRE